MLNRIVFILIYNIFTLIFVPVAITLFMGFGYKPSSENEANTIDIINNIDIETEEATQAYDKNNLDEYIVGVLAAEMPVSFEKEALKAQAVAARTYAYRRTGSIDDEIDHTKIGQAYNSLEQMKSKWGENFDTYYKKICDAVYSTSGILITYKEEPIEAVFHSTSAGVTETAENVWGKNLPYIKSVESSADENAPNFTYTTKIENDKFIKEILKKFPKIDKNKIIDSFKITKRSSSDYVLEVDILGNKLTGRKIREMFGLRSTNFTINKTKDNIEFTTKGYGHGAGLSQYGANFMAKDGADYKEILEHYYSDIELSKVY